MDEEPKFGLVVSLVLMNLAAVALFFLATPPSMKQDIETTHFNENPQQQVKKVEMVMAGDAETKLMCEEDVFPMLTNEAELGPVPFSTPNMGKMDAKSPGYSVHALDNISKVDTPVALPPLVTPNRSSQQEQVSPVNAIPPLSTAMKRFVRNSKSGMLRLFNGLKNGYVEKRVSPEIGNKLECKQSSEVLSHDSNATQETTISTEIVMDVLSKTQKRTAELIEIFNNKVVPAIERMNEKVAEAVCLEKNLDSYTLALISAIDSVVCPASKEDQKNRQPENGVIKKSSQTRPFGSEPFLVMRDSQTNGYVRSFSKGEHSIPTKRPVLKTLNACCLHHRHYKIPRKRKRHQERSEQRFRLRRFDDQILHSKCKPSGVGDESFLKEPDSLCETENIHGKYNDPVKGEYSCAPANHCISQGLPKFEESSHERTICIEDVLALTSSLEQSCDHDVQSDMNFKSVQSGFSSDFPVYSGMRMGSMYFIGTPIHKNASLSSTEEKFTNAPFISHGIESPETISTRRPELANNLAELVQEPSYTMAADCSIAYDSRIQEYDSYLARRESSSITQLHFRRQHQTIDLKSVLQETASKHHVSGNMKNTNDLVKTFKRLDLQEREIAMENVCLLVLRIFEAWSESQQSISPLGLSKISLSSWSSKDEYLDENHPGTAILESTNVGCVQESLSHGELQSPMDDISSSNITSEHPLPNEQQPDLPTQLIRSASSTIISRIIMQGIVEAAEVQIADQSLKGFTTNFRTLPIKGDQWYSTSPDAGNPSGFEDIKNSTTAIVNKNVPLVSTSHDTIAEDSKESSSSTFYADLPESSEDAFFECKSTTSAGTYSLDVEDSSKSFLEKIQEEEGTHQENSPEAKLVNKYPQSSRFNIAPRLKGSGEESTLTIADLQSQELSDNSSVDVGCGTDDETYPCNSLDSSTDEFVADVTQSGKEKKNKWRVRLLRKFLKRKPKPSPLPITPSNSESRSPSDFAVLKLNDEMFVKNVDEQTQ